MTWTDEDDCYSGRHWRWVGRYEFHYTTWGLIKHWWRRWRD